MSKTSKKNTKSIVNNPKVNFVTKTSFNLGEVRANFDGLKDVAATLPEGKAKVSIMSKIEEIYLHTATWIQQLAGGAAEAV